MSIKKKLGLGVASAALGLSLIGGGTWAAFNDIETVGSSFAAGTLNLDVNNGDGATALFDLSNLKPGDTMEREFLLSNAGSLAIKDVLMTTAITSFTQGENEYVNTHGATDNSQEDFLDQFNVNIIDVDRQITVVQNKTLKDLLTETPNLAPTNTNDPRYSGIPLNPADTENIRIQITFKDDPTVGINGEQDQNKYQGDSAQISFTLEATQWAGLTTDQTKDNGYLDINKEANSN
ncbi:TasA family protein [Schinkia azotoformans]|uniref:TasA family protein n=1 Tax=Schinkia azotoformans TaxID=1454 RepID=UPI002DBC557E|nr:TasA family protein [Schinkia azotoformans]MEC1721284.1 TasA family protein [Schinkia azotoformans]MED4352435.1 TasA family protein [Schinkia azotoformans]MED4414431.1 TasA family protein [Schinkia azotoformans]